jgi:hypothetical protein
MEFRIHPFEAAQVERIQLGTGDELAQQLRHDGGIAEKPMVESVVVRAGCGHDDWRLVGCEPERSRERS